MGALPPPGAAAAAAAVGPDRAALARIAAETGAVTTPPSPSPAAYVTYLASRAAEALRAWLHGLHVDLGAVAPLLEVAARALAVAVVVAAAWVLYRRLAARSDARPAPRVAAPRPLGRETGRAPPAAWWWARFEEAAERGDPPAALAALWMWAAVRLAGADPDPAWTSRELLERTGRRELAPLLARLDRWRFGPWTPTASDLHGLARALSEAAP